MTRFPSGHPDDEDLGGLAHGSFGSNSPHTAKSVTEVMASMELPWPKDVFGEVPKDDWSDIDDWLRENKGYAIDCVSGDLMRRGWKVYERLLRERVNDLVEDGFEVTTHVANPPQSPPKTSTVDTLAKILSQNFYYKLDSEGGKVVCLNQKKAMQQLNQLLYDARIETYESLLPLTEHQPHKSLKSAAHTRNHLRDDFKTVLLDRIAELKALKGESTQ